jgi:hypothetical protein
MRVRPVIMRPGRRFEALRQVWTADLLSSTEVAHTPDAPPTAPPRHPRSRTRADHRRAAPQPLRKRIACPPTDVCSSPALGMRPAPNTFHESLRAGALPKSRGANARTLSLAPPKPTARRRKANRQSCHAARRLRRAIHHSGNGDSASSFSPCEMFPAGFKSNNGVGLGCRPLFTSRRRAGSFLPAGASLL